MKRVFLLVLCAVAASLISVGRAASDPVWSGQCGIAAQQTVWGEYGWPALLPILARPGTLLAVTTHSNGTDYAVEARRRGAATYAFDLSLKARVGTPTAPADPSTIEGAAQAEYGKAVVRTGGCFTPLIVLNELFGATIPTPWTVSTAQYRANVLAFLQDLAAQGAHPVLLVNKSPYTASSDAVAWWLAVAKVSDVVREVYPPATSTWPLGPIVGNRVLRQRYRQAAADFTSIGIPANRLGIMLSFLSQKGGGGRNGLGPSAWYQVVKWEALSVKQVAGEIGLGSVFSWGWQEWNPKEVDPTKPKAACVWLWARQRSLCNAPRKLGRHFNRSVTLGQIILPNGAVCAAQRLGSIGGQAVASLQVLTGDRSAALSALFERLVEAGERGVSRHAVLAAEREVVRESFHGNRSDYVAALHQAHASVGIARGALADELRRARLEQLRYAPKPTAREVVAFYYGYPDLLARRVHVSPSPPWLGGRRTGFALTEAAPQRLFALPTGKKARLATLLGTFAVRPLAPAQPLGALPLTTVRPAIVAALRGFERAQAFEHWTIALQNAALSRTICLRDQLPQPAAIDLTEYLPFLRMQ